MVEVELGRRSSRGKESEAPDQSGEGLHEVPLVKYNEYNFFKWWQV